MGKEEFLRILNARIDELKEKYDAAKSKLGTLEQDSAEYKQTERELEMWRNEIATAKKSLYSFAYARIKAMSNIELEEYRKEKIAELLSLEEFLSIKYYTEFKAEKNNPSEYRKLAMSEINVARQKVTSEIKRTQTKTLQQIKNGLSDDIIYLMYYKSDADTRELRSEINGAIASVAGDKDKTERMNALLKEHDALLEEVQKLTDGIVFTIPKEFQKGGKLADLKLEEYLETNNRYTFRAEPAFAPYHSLDKLEQVKIFRGSFDSGKITVRAESDFMNVLKGFKTVFDKKAEYILGLIDRLTTLKDFSFTDFKGAQEKLPSEEFEELERLTQEQQRLSKKILKTQATKSRLDLISAQIGTLHAKLRQPYLKASLPGYDKLLGLGTNSQSFDEFKQTIYETQSAIAGLINSFVNESKVNDIQVKGILSSKSFNAYSVSKQIYDIAGVDFFHATSEFSHFVNLPFGENAVLARAEAVKKEKIAQKVEKDAQEEADKKEAELKGLTIEELSALKESMERIFNSFPSKEQRIEEISPAEIARINEGLAKAISPEDVQKYKERRM